MIHLQYKVSQHIPFFFLLKHPAVVITVASMIILPSILIYVHEQGPIAKFLFSSSLFQIYDNHIQ